MKRIFQRLNPTEQALELLLGVLFINSLLINSLGRITGWLSSIGAFCGVLLLGVTLCGFYSLYLKFQIELGRRWTMLFLVVLGIQIFWAWFRAPLDVDGLFYHLTIVLEALQKDRWGDWNYPIWTVQANPKFAEINSLTFISLGGWRLAQFGHFASALLGALAFHRIGLSANLNKPSLLAFVYLLTPLVVKQMSSNYVDLFLWSSWAATFALLIKLKANSVDYVFAGIAGYLVCGTKISGPLILLAFLPLLLWVSFKNKRIPYLGVGTLICFSILGVLSWTFPNFLKFGNPIYPLNPLGMIPGSVNTVLPEDVPVHHLHGFASTLGFSNPVTWFLNLFIIEPVPTYDMAGGAWGFVVMWAFLFLIITKFSTLHKIFKIWILKPKKSLMETSPIELFAICIVLAFVLMPGRFMPRYSLLAGFVLIIPAIGFVLRKEASKFWTQFMSVMLIVQALYVLPDRPWVRGTNTSTNPLPILAENLKDIILTGEPQHPDRWLHFPYVPQMRKVTGTKTQPGEGCVDLSALYWGKYFDNIVEPTRECCRWPDCSTSSP